MTSVSGYTWQRKFKANVGDRYSGYCGHYEFVFLGQRLKTFRDIKRL
jgi:hypothetical protein